MSCVDINLKKWIVFIILCYSFFLFINIGPMYDGEIRACTNVSASPFQFT